MMLRGSECSTLHTKVRQTLRCLGKILSEARLPCIDYLPYTTVYNSYCTDEETFMDIFRKFHELFSSLKETSKAWLFTK